MATGTCVCGERAVETVLLVRRGSVRGTVLHAKLCCVKHVGEELVLAATGLSMVDIALMPVGYVVPDADRARTFTFTGKLD